jgi:RIO kinase 1
MNAKLTRRSQPAQPGRRQPRSKDTYVARQLFLTRKRVADGGDDTQGDKVSTPMDKYDFYEAYEGYERQFFHESRSKRRERQRKARRTAGGAPLPEAPAAREPENDPVAFDPSYMRDKKEDNQERLWIIEHLQGFYEEEFIADVVAAVKSGKEASVYVCTAHETLETPYVAAKIYRPAIFRALKNDAAYREGRYGARSEGKHAADLMDERMARAIAGRTGFGKAVLLSTWIGHEFTMMQKLYDAGVSIPEPIGQKGNAILMEYVGALHQPAPPLHYITLGPAEAQPLFDQLLEDVRTMLTLDIVHGDFSAYNILYWDGEAKIIDFPQAINPWYNANALFMLERDITRLCQYFARYGVVDASGRTPDPVALTTDLWQRYMNNELV